MGRKKRFGVAIDFSLAEKLDTIAKTMNIDRSRLVEVALSEFVEEHRHSLEEHKCCGIMFVEAKECGLIDKVVESYRDIIVSYTHNHVEKRCICMVIVLGSSGKVKNLHKEFMVKSHRARYIPIAHD
ncbi:MAG: ribbon-helix-helix domain-containing protein [Ignisphaera sp.]|uniref:Ribbon-helix-helix domain-containing protein n=1 Tax=Ignisphaera aggregans TaxID=334771 RepID=A0A7C4JKQ1_9CREN